jgi:phosphinothricin acetyltransferase
MSEVRVREARTEDAGAIARIFNQGIAERVATFETREQDPARFADAIGRGDLVLVAESGGAIAGAAWVGPYADPHDYYAGVGEATLYVVPEARRSGVGRALLAGLAADAPTHGLHKLVGKVFASNEPSRKLLRACGWREVGTHLRHGSLDGKWKDVLVVELVLSPP